MPSMPVGSTNWRGIAIGASERVVDGAGRRRLPFRPTPLVRLAWGSMSTSRTCWSARASEAARLMAVVVLPTPPFWLAIAMIRDISVI